MSLATHTPTLAHTLSGLVVTPAEAAATTPRLRPTLPRRTLTMEVLRRFGDSVVAGTLLDLPDARRGLARSRMSGTPSASNKGFAPVNSYLTYLLGGKRDGKVDIGVCFGSPSSIHCL